MEIFTGTLPDTRVLSECRCSPEYPALKDSDMTFCVQNEGDGQNTLETYRISRWVNHGDLLYPQTKVGDILDSGPSRRRRRRNFLVYAITQKRINIFFSNLVHMLRKIPILR